VERHILVLVLGRGPVTGVWTVIVPDSCRSCFIGRIVLDSGGAAIGLIDRLVVPEGEQQHREIAGNRHYGLALGVRPAAFGELEALAFGPNLCALATSTRWPKPSRIRLVHRLCVPTSIAINALGHLRLSAVRLLRLLAMDSCLMTSPLASSTHTACLRSPRSIPIVMADDEDVFIFMAAGSCQIGPGLALLPSHLFLFG
jgi:hypothetical protein